MQDHGVENGGGSQVLSECEDFKQEQSRISRLERQAQDFLNAVFHRKGSSPNITLSSLSSRFQEHHEDEYWTFHFGSSEFLRLERLENAPVFGCFSSQHNILLSQMFSIHVFISII